MKKYLNIILVTAAFCLWVVIFYKIVWQDEEQESGPVNYKQSRNLNLQTTSNDSLYPEDRQKDPFRNRFNYPPPKKKITSNKIRREIPKKDPPRMTLLGIISDPRGAIAMISFPDNSVKFLRVNDKFSDIELVEINSKEVAFKFDNRVHLLSLK